MNEINPKINEFLNEIHTDPKKIKLCQDIKLIYTATDEESTKEIIYMDDLNKQLRSYNLPEIW